MWFYKWFIYLGNNLIQRCAWNVIATFETPKLFYSFSNGALLSLSTSRSGYRLYSGVSNSFVLERDVSGSWVVQKSHSRCVMEDSISLTWPYGFLRFIVFLHLLTYNLMLCFFSETSDMVYFSFDHEWEIDADFINSIEF